MADKRFVAGLGMILAEAALLALLTTVQLGVTGHKTLAELQRYTQAADQARMARDAVGHLSRP
jgi:hypothetical protein